MVATIKDIAERVGVSTMTVSRVINNSGYVSMQTRKKVEAAIKALNYQPNLLARSLINRKSSFVYVIVPDISNPFYADLTKGVERVAKSASYNIILSSAYWKETLECEHIEAARGRMAEGIILVLPKISEKKIAAYAKRIPLVVVDKHIRSKSIDKVYLYQNKGAFLAVEHLITLGHRRIAFLSGESHIYNSRSRQHGYEDALSHYGIPFDPALVLKGDFSFETGERAFQQIFDMAPQKRPTAIFAASDLMALGFMRNAFRYGVRIPDDISLVGFDDILLASITNPPLTTIRHPYREMGEEAMNHLLKKLNEGFQPSDRKPLVNQLIIRETTKLFSGDEL
ncbi:LacI family DNA-binding transcriptional regulator [Sediminispirochaeta smaragdinae]|uniref:Transcriptional regulator, LacI family n=1 Tax=Sediminispirochaeta smaragdinae (strain DSM 11293 / JCM 15392 / SEBR 4228) TaxID=573413 RepID=E1R2I3_SEDSS|nr:LacI family DNA-binding transcriptional regulator [Sediminispirochaeta smaragdinae]ADK82543.1 transcriptional regulator, LacI family [Sediminispirochaeta smaragdinae DSM 11293]